MKKQFIALFLGFALFSVFCSFSYQKEQAVIPPGTDAVELNWKIAEGDTLFYETVMTEIEESTSELTEDDQPEESTDSFDLKLLERVQDYYANTDFVTRLYHSPYFEDVLHVEMIANREDKADNEEDVLPEGFANLLTGVVLRGSVYTNGSLHSFWLKSGQKNMISMLFELPDFPVKAGDSWSLTNVNYVGNDQNFICREARKRNVVTLLEIKEEEGEQIAVLDYDIMEYVSGDFRVSGFFGGESSDSSNMTMEFIFRCRAEFSVDQGKWLSYNGILSLESTGFMGSSSKQQFALMER